MGANVALLAFLLADPFNVSASDLRQFPSHNYTAFMVEIGDKVEKEYLIPSRNAALSQREYIYWWERIEAHRQILACWKDLEKAYNCPEDVRDHLYSLQHRIGKSAYMLGHMPFWP